MCCTSFSRSTLPPVKIGVPYNQTLEGIGCPGGYTITLVGGSLPPGINFSQSSGNPATLKGKPTKLGKFSFTLRLSSLECPNIDQTFSIIVKTKSSAKGGYVPNPFDLFYGRISCPRGNYNDCANGACVEWSAQYGWSNAAFATCQNLCKNGCGGGGSSKTSGGGQSGGVEGIRGMPIPSLKNSGQSGQRVSSGGAGANR